MRILISTIGSHGDVLPFIALGREFAGRGHQVVFYANPYFHRYAVEVGIAFVPIDTVESYSTLFGNATENDPAKAFKNIAHHYATVCPAYYSAMKADVIAGETITIGNSLLFASRLLSETENIPCATIHLAPTIFHSDLKPARLNANWIDPDASLAFKQFAWRATNKFFHDPNFTAPLNVFRSKLGLASVKNIFDSWIHNTDCVIGMFPSWFAQPQNDWPHNAILTGFPLYDHGNHGPLSSELTAFIESGSPPVAFSAGTASAVAKQFFTSSIGACQQAGLRAILLANFTDQIPSSLPSNVMHVAYAPFTTLLPKLAAIVHHGGIGTTSQALHAGVPQLIRPVAYDQFDNSNRAVELGVAEEILPENYTSESAALALEKLISNDVLRQQCRQVAMRFADDNSIATACDAILASLGDRLKTDG